MSQDACALNADGSLKDAADITFFNDPDNDVPLPNVPPSTQPSTSTASTRDAYSVLLKAGRTPATVAAGSRQSGRPLKPSARMRDADNACGLSSGTRKHALSSTTDHLALKKDVNPGSALQLLKAGYHNGHISAATEAEEFAAMLD
ncbi:hypothetical protein EV424DRAFT_1538485 [Suillus variegatus]|nr:hypothetical protein EV424DRAFT_1538485 [Suillus variegatus]